MPWNSDHEGLIPERYQVFESLILRQWCAWDTGMRMYEWTQSAIYACSPFATFTYNATASRSSFFASFSKGVCAP